MGQAQCLCEQQRIMNKPKKRSNTLDRDSLTGYSSYGIQQILKEQVRIMIIGTKQSGKTTLMNNLILGNLKKGQSFTMKQLPHGGIQFRNINIFLGDIHSQNYQQCRFLDVEGNIFDQIDHIKQHITTCDGFILMTDIQNDNCIDDVQSILNELSQYFNSKPILIIANKYESNLYQNNKDSLYSISQKYNNCLFSTTSLHDKISEDYKKPIQDIVYASSKITPKNNNV